MHCRSYSAIALMMTTGCGVWHCCPQISRHALTPARVDGMHLCWRIASKVQRLDDDPKGTMAKASSCTGKVLHDMEAPSWHCTRSSQAGTWQTFHTGQAESLGSPTACPAGMPGSGSGRRSSRSCSNFIIMASCMVGMWALVTELTLHVVLDTRQVVPQRFPGLAAPLLLLYRAVREGACKRLSMNLSYNSA